MINNRSLLFFGFFFLLFFLSLQPRYEYIKASEVEDWHEYIPKEYQHYIPKEAKEAKEANYNNNDRGRKRIDGEIKGGGRIKITDEYTARVRSRVEENEKTDIDTYKAKEKKVETEEEENNHHHNHNNKKKKKDRPDSSHYEDKDDHHHKYGSSHDLMDISDNDSHNIADSEDLIYSDDNTNRMDKTINLTINRPWLSVLVFFISLLFLFSFLLILFLWLRPCYYYYWGYSNIDGKTLSTIDDNRSWQAA